MADHAGVQHVVDREFVRREGFRIKLRPFSRRNGYFRDLLAQVPNSRMWREAANA